MVHSQVTLNSQKAKYHLRLPTNSAIDCLSRSYIRKVKK